MSPPRAARAQEQPAERTAYSDGHPLDAVQYLEAKLILKPDRFTSVEGFHEFGKIVRHAAREVEKVDCAEIDRDVRPQIREIIFIDTPDFRLYNNAFILRRRISYVDGFPAGDPEITLKFRHPDEQKAAATDIRPKIPGKYRVKFKAEALPLKGEIGGLRLLFSHNCIFGLSQVHLGDRFAASTLYRAFPALDALRDIDARKVEVVNGAIVEEVLLDLGRLDFGKGITAKANVALWRTRGEHKSLVGEFAFQTKFDRKEDVHQKAKDRVQQFFITLQRTAKDWISLGTTKTGMVYRLNGNPPQSHE